MTLPHKKVVVTETRSTDNDTTLTGASLLWLKWGHGTESVGHDILMCLPVQ